MIILGVSAFYHDSAIAIIKDGEILYSAQEERFTRKKHDVDFPVNALKTLIMRIGNLLIMLRNNINKGVNYEIIDFKRTV